MLTTDKDKISNTDDKVENRIEGTSATLNINWDNIINHKCPHLLPCGVCEITNKMCPLNGWNDLKWTISTDKVTCDTLDRKEKPHD